MFALSGVSHRKIRLLQIKMHFASQDTKQTGPVIQLLDDVGSSFPHTRGDKAGQHGMAAYRFKSMYLVLLPYSGARRALASLPVSLRLPPCRQAPRQPPGHMAPQHGRIIMKNDASERERERERASRAPAASAASVTRSTSPQYTVVPATRRSSVGAERFLSLPQGRETVCRQQSLLRQPCIHSVEP